MKALYGVTTPVRNEMAILPALVETMDRLNPRPFLWLVVDDGSTDGSRAWLEERAAERGWMMVVGASGSSDEYLGAHIARIKRWGLEVLARRCDASGERVQCIGVLDADVALPPDHYGRLLDAFEADPRLGIASSLLSVPEHGGLRVEPFQRSDLPMGPTQTFRRACLDAIGGLPPWPGFDGAANTLAQLAGWRTAIVPGATAIHRRATATRFGAAPGFERKGRYAWFLGLHPVLVAARALAYCVERPHSAGAYFPKGWLSDALRGAPRCPSEDLRRANGWPRVVRVAKAAVGAGRARYADRT
jgi:glycosyltransferase involved in cell wall biosynthesis